MKTSIFDVTWIDKTGCVRHAEVIAPDAESALRSYRHANPEIRDKVLRCGLAGEKAETACA